MADGTDPGLSASAVEVLASRNGGLTGTHAASLRDGHAVRLSRRCRCLRLGLEVGSEVHESGREAVTFEADAFDGATEGGCLGGGER